MAQHRQYAGRSAAERDTDRLVRLRAAALDLFGTEGFGAVPVDRLCAAAKVSTRHFYQVFSGKEDALLDVYAVITSQSLVDVSLALERTEGESIRPRLRAAVAAYLGPILADPRMARLAFVEMVGISPRVEAQRLEFRAGIVALIERESAAALDRGEVMPRDFRFSALAFLGAVNVVVHDWSATTNPADSADELREKLSDLAVELVAGNVS